MYRRVLTASALTGIGLCVVNWLANTFYWYVTIGWFDMPMHGIGGVFVALCGAAALAKRKSVLTTSELLITILLFVFVVGLAWEYYEYIVQFFVKGVQLASISDSISDLICDMIGGVVGVSFVLLLQKRYNKD